MQSTFRLPYLLALATILVLASCSKTNKQGKMIPKEAAIVVLVNGESISSKLPWEEVKKNQLFEELYKDSTIDAFIKSALDNPDNTGIDTKKDFMFFVQKDSIGGYVAIEGTIKDAATFKKFTSQAIKGAVETEKNGIHFIAANKVTASWENDKCIIVIDAPELNDINKYSNTFDTNPSSKSMSQRDGKAVCSNLYALKENNSLAKEAKFTELVNQKGDIHFWMNVGQLNTGSVGMAAMSMLNLSKLYEGSIATASASFDDGQINVDMKSYAGKELTDIWKKYSGTKVNTDMIKRVTGKDVAVLFALNFKPEGIREFVKLAGLEGFINMGSMLLGFNLEDFVKANKGDILFALSDFKMDSIGMGKPDMNIMFAASVGDKSSFGKLIDAGNRLGKDKLGAAASEVFYNSNDKLFAIGNKKEAVNSFIANEGKNNFSFLDKISGGPSAAYIDFQMLMKAFAKEAGRDSLDNIIFEASLKTWDNLIAKGGGFEKGGTVQHIELNLMDKKTNSLKQLNNYLGVIARIGKQKEEKRKAEMRAFYSEEDFAPAVVDTTAASY